MASKGDEKKEVPLSNGKRKYKQESLYRSNELHSLKLVPLIVDYEYRECTVMNAFPAT